jgi:FtsZ-binding cell division protein ZapB
MALDAQDVETIRRIFDERATRTEESVIRMEEKIFAEIEKVSDKVDCLANIQQDMAERVTRLEESNTVLKDSRNNQGERIGRVEESIVAIRTKIETIDKVRSAGGEWTKWAVGLIVAAVLAVIGFFIGQGTGGGKP